ncbi:hypothetical protein RKD42_001552 [Streptomyces ambofaciens]
MAFADGAGDFAESRTYGEQGLDLRNGQEASLGSGLVGSRGRPRLIRIVQRPRLQLLVAQFCHVCPFVAYRSRESAEVAALCQ